MEYIIYALSGGDYTTWPFGHSFDLAIIEFGKLVAGQHFDAIHLIGKGPQDDCARLFAAYSREGFEGFRTS